MNLNESIQQVAKGANIVFLGVVISKILGFIYRAIVARISVAEYGTISLGLAIVSFLITISLIGMDFGIMRYLPDYQEKKNRQKVLSTISTATLITAVTSILFAIAVFLYASRLAALFGNPQLAPVLKILAFVLPLDVLRIVLFSILKSFKLAQYEIYGKNIIENVAKVLLTLILLMLGFGLIGATLAHLAAIFVSFLAAIYFVKKNPFQKVDQLFTKSINREVIWYSLPLVLNALIILVISWSDTILLGIFRTSEEIGLYNAAIPLANLMYIFPNALLIIFLPILTTLYVQKESATFNTLYQTITKWILTINVLILLAFILLAPQFLAYSFGWPYLAARNALIILTLGNLLYYAALTANNVLLTLKKTRFIFFTSILGAGSNILLNLYMIPRYGFLGASLTTLFSQALMTSLLFLKARTILHTPFPGKDYLKILIAAFIAGGLALVIKLQFQHHLAQFIITLLVLGISFAALLLAMKYVREEEKIVLRYIRDKYHLKLPLIERFFR